MRNFEVGQDFHFFRGRVALYAILRGLGIGPGDEVAIQAFTCLAVPEGVMATGARPLWIDIEVDGYTMDPDDLARKLTPRTRAIVVQHTYGIPTDLDAIVDIAREREIPVVEDCAHTLLSTYRGRRVGTVGVGAFYSFEWGKPIVAGVGGSAVVNDGRLRTEMEAAYRAFKVPPFQTRAKLLLQYYGYRVLYRPSLYWPVRSLFHALGDLGLVEGNYNPVGAEQMADDFSWRMVPESRRRLEKALQDVERLAQHSQWVAQQYRHGISSPELQHPRLPHDSSVVFARYPLRTPRKRALLEAARRARVELADWYATPVHPLQPGELHAVGYEPGTCPRAERRASEVVSLPTHVRVQPQDVERTLEFFERMS